MAKKTTKTGKALERQVANACRAIGAWKVEHDVELAGHQIDVYVEMETSDRALHRIAVEAKDYTKPVGIEIVSGFAAVVNGLRTLKLIDEGVIVSAAGFSRPARNAAKEHGLRLLEPADLEAMAGGSDLEQMRADYLASLRQRFEYLDLGGIAPRVQNRTVKLRMEDVFVPVQARPELESRAEWPKWMAEMPEDAEGEEMALRMMARREQAAEAKPVDIPELLRRPRVVVLGDVRAVDGLLARLEDEYCDVRWSATIALGALSDARAVEPLLARLEDEVEDVRGSAYGALVAILNHNAPQPEAEEVACQPQAVPGPWDG